MDVVVELRADRAFALHRVLQLQSEVSTTEGSATGTTEMRQGLLSTLANVKAALEGGIVTVRGTTVETAITLEFYGDRVAYDQVPRLFASEIARLRALLQAVDDALRSPLPAPPTGNPWAVVVPDTNTIVRTLHLDDPSWRTVAPGPVLVVIPQIVYDELDNRKNDRNNAEARHARNAVGKIETWNGPPGEAGQVQEGVWLYVLPERLDHLRLPVNDNEIADVARRLRDAGEHVTFLSLDGGARTRARDAGLTAAAPPETVHRVDLDPVERERDDLRRELDKLTRSRPDLLVRFATGDRVLRRPRPADGTVPDVDDVVELGRDQEFPAHHAALLTWAEANRHAYVLQRVAIPLDLQVVNNGAGAARNVKVVLSLSGCAADLAFAVIGEARPDEPPSSVPQIRLSEHASDPEWTVGVDGRTASTTARIVRHGDSHTLEASLLLYRRPGRFVGQDLAVRWRCIDDGNLDQEGDVSVLAKPDAEKTGGHL